QRSVPAAVTRSTAPGRGPNVRRPIACAACWSAVSSRIPATGASGGALPSRAAPPPHAVTARSEMNGMNGRTRMIMVNGIPVPEFCCASDPGQLTRRLCKLSHMTSTSETPDLRYPIGKRVPRTSFTDASRAAALKTIAETPANLRRAVTGLNDAQLDTPYRPGGWTVRQLVHHVADSHMHAYMRTRFTLTEENPPVKPYPEAVWAELADAKTMPVESSLAILDGLHARWIRLFESLQPAQFARTMFHP